MSDNSHRQAHVGLAVVYGVWQYYQATADLAFLRDGGADLMIEVTRHFASRATYDVAEDRSDIAAVMGPDEFHDGYPDAPGQGLRDNAYTNVTGRLDDRTDAWRSSTSWRRGGLRTAGRPAGHAPRGT